MTAIVHKDIKKSLEETYDEITLFPTVVCPTNEYFIDIIDEVDEMATNGKVSIDFWTIMGVDSHADGGINATPICSFKSKYEAIDWIQKMKDTYDVSFMPSTRIDIIADRFSELLAERIGNDNLRNVVDKNNMVENLGCCASHDYCDANVIMDKAVKYVGLNMRVNSDLGCYVMNNAWDTAKQSSFYLSHDLNPSISID